jgi:hypothetical protein
MAAKIPFLTRFWPLVLVVTTITLSLLLYAFSQVRTSQLSIQLTNADLRQLIASAEGKIKTLDSQISTLESEDLRATNRQVLQNISDLKATYRSALVQYEEILKLQTQPSSKTTLLETTFASVLSSLAKDDLKGARDNTQKLTTEIVKEESRLAALKPASVVAIPANVPAKSTPPSSGFSRQKVSVEGSGDFLVDIVAADLGSTRVIVDTASVGTCGNDCPVLPLATYVSRTGAFAGVNGSYFCPASYPSCAGKTNSFDLLLMNKDKVYFNSENNVYSSNPGVVFGSGYIRFLSAVSGWGRDTGIDGMISNFPLLVANDNITFGGDSDAKQSPRGNRSFVSNKGNTVYIGVVHGVAVAESAKVMKAMGMNNALNLDDGGSTALWSGGYKVGPGRDLPNVILFVRK